MEKCIKKRLRLINKMELDCSFKFVMVDDSETRKTNFFVSLNISDKFTLDSKTIGIKYTSKMIQIEGKEIRI